MTMKTVKLWSVQEWDGGDRHNHKFYLTNKEEADRYLKDHKFDIVVEVTLDMFDTLEEVEE